VLGYKFDYEKKVWGGDIIRLRPIYFRASRLKYALKELAKVKGKILDLGCGVGDFSEAIGFYRPDLGIYSVDISAHAIALANKRGLKAKFSVADAHHLPFKDNYFDAVVCFDLIEHVKSPKKVLEEINRVLKRGGLFHTFIPTEGNVYSLQGALIALGWKAKEKYGAHPHHFPPNEVKSWVKGAGFTIIKLRWGEHLVNQIIEIIYFSLLEIRGRNVSSSVEGYLARTKARPLIKIIILVRNVLATLSYYETSFLWWFPGLGLHITCLKD